VYSTALILTKNTLFCSDYMTLLFFLLSAPPLTPFYYKYLKYKEKILLMLSHKPLFLSTVLFVVPRGTLSPFFVVGLLICVVVFVLGGGCLVFFWR